MRKTYIAGNWKMNKNKAEAVELAKGLVEALKDGKNKYMIGVPYVYLDAVAQVVKGSNILLAAQDVILSDEKLLSLASKYGMDDSTLSRAFRRFAALSVRLPSKEQHLLSPRSCKTE